ncbi:baeRF2 domain-containing protein [Arthrobacter monumenti]
MRYPWLKDVLEADPPFLSVYVDTTRTDPSAAAEIETRWEHLRDKVRAEGAPKDLLKRIERSVLEPAGIGGPHGRAYLAAGGQLYIDRVLPVPPENYASCNHRPHLLPLMRVAARAVSHLLVEVDRSGADISLRAPEDPHVAGSQKPLGEDASIEGGHDELHKTGTGWRGQDFEARVEDSWERNADAVAHRLDKLVRQYRPDLVLLTGDVRAASLLKEAVGQETRQRLVDVPGGGRNEGVDRAEFRVHVEEAVDNFIAFREKAAVDRFVAEQSRDGESLAGAAEVRAALERGQVDELLLTSGSEPDDIEDLLYLALRTDAAVQSLDPGEIVLPDGIGALLRWRDEATPSNAVPSLSDDREREREAS